MFGCTGCLLLPHCQKNGRDTSLAETVVCVFCLRPEGIPTGALEVTVTLVAGVAFSDSLCKFVCN